MSDTHKNIVAALKGRDSRNVSNNTKALRLPDGSVSIRLHKTDILTARPDGSVVVNSGGWRTVTTKSRLNEWLADGLSLSQAGGIWFWHRRHSYNEATGWQWDKLPAFSDGDVIGPRGGLISAGSPTATAEARKLSQEVNDYAKKCAAAVPMAKPSGGDCWHCALVVVPTDAKPEPVQSRMHCAKGEAPRTLQTSWGDASKNTEHLRQHMAEGYVVPSLVFHALKEAGAGDLILSGAFGEWAGGEGLARGYVTRAVRRYLKRRLALAGN